MGDEIIIVIVVATALAFDFTNGFHDTANVVATSISTRALPPRTAVGIAAILNFLGAGLLGKVVVPALVAPLVAFAGGWVSILVAYRLIGRLRPGHVTRGFRLGQVASGGLLALAHGTNDA